MNATVKHGRKLKAVSVAARSAKAPITEIAGNINFLWQYANGTMDLPLA